MGTQNYTVSISLTAQARSRMQPLGVLETAEARREFTIPSGEGAYSRMAVGTVAGSVARALGGALKGVSVSVRNDFLDSIKDGMERLFYALKSNPNNTAFPVGISHGHTQQDFNRIGKMAHKGPYAQPMMTLPDEPDPDAIHRQTTARREPDYLMRNMTLGHTYLNSEKSIRVSAFEVDPAVWYWRYLKYGTVKMVPRQIDQAIMRTAEFERFITEGVFSKFESLAVRDVGKSVSKAFSNAGLRKT